MKSMLSISRAMHTTRVLRADIVVPARPVRKIGAIRGGFTGFLFGVVCTGGAAYYYLFDQYQAGQQAILADVISLRESIGELSSTVEDLKKAAK